MNIPGQRKRREMPAEALGKCPRGHDLPNMVSGIECSPLACGGTFESADASSPNPKSEERQLEHEANRIAKREELRNKLVPTPRDLTGAAADEYVERKITELQPIAIAEMEWQLRFGGDAERAKAARDILDAGGHGKKDRVGASANMIIINMGGGNGNGSPPPLPYVGEVVDAATKALPK